MNDIVHKFEIMEPMKYYDNANPSTDGAKKKRAEIIGNKDHKYIASKKNDGD